MTPRGWDMKIEVAILILLDSVVQSHLLHRIAPPKYVAILILLDSVVQFEKLKNENGYGTRRNPYFTRFCCAMQPTRIE